MFLEYCLILVGRAQEQNNYIYGNQIWDVRELRKRYNCNLCSKRLSRCKNIENCVVSDSATKEPTGQRFEALSRRHGQVAGRRCTWAGHLVGI